MGAAAVAGEPLDGHGEGLLPGHGHVAGGVGGRLLDDKHGARRQGGHLVMNLEKMSLERGR